MIGAGVEPQFAPSAVRPLPRADRVLPADVDSYVVAVTGGDERKNTEGLLRGWGRLDPALRSSHHLVIATAHSPAVLRRWEGWAAEAGVSDRVVFTGSVDDDEMVSILQGARLAVMPSLEEGFGLPVVEAAACGVPVICSNFTSLPEVLDEPAACFDPRDPDAIAHAIDRALTDESHRAGAAHRGRVGGAALDVAACRPATRSTAWRNLGPRWTRPIQRPCEPDRDGRTVRRLCVGDRRVRRGGPRGDAHAPPIVKSFRFVDSSDRRAPTNGRLRHGGVRSVAGAVARAVPEAVGVRRHRRGARRLAASRGHGRSGRRAGMCGCTRPRWGSTSDPRGFGLLEYVRAEFGLALSRAANCCEVAHRRLGAGSGRTPPRPPAGSVPSSCCLSRTRRVSSGASPSDVEVVVWAWASGDAELEMLVRVAARLASSDPTVSIVVIGEAYGASIDDARELAERVNADADIVFEPFPTTDGRCVDSRTRGSGFSSVASRQWSRCRPRSPTSSTSASRRSRHLTPPARRVPGLQVVTFEVEAIADAIRPLLTDDHAWTAASADALERARAWTFDDVARELLRWLDDVDDLDRRRSVGWGRC